MGACAGLCCVAFYFPVTSEELSQRTPRMRDGQKIANMLIPLTNKEAAERLERFGSLAEPPEARDEGHFYTCRHWDEETKLCTIYEHRPDMCRYFPYGMDCEHGCPHVGAPISEKREG